MPTDAVAIADDLCELLARDASAPGEIAARILAAATAGALPGALLLIVAGGRYDRLIDVLTADEVCDSAALRALAAARPTHDVAALNRAAEAAARARGPGAGERPTPYDLLIVPGYTPLDAPEPLPLQRVPAACRRVEQAYRDYQAGLAPFVLLSGGAVHPPGTPHNEALMMRAALLEAGLPEVALLVDPFARHSTTNLRNAGRIMRALGLPRGLVVTGFDRVAFSQAFYFSNPTLSTFHRRCRGELGYTVGELEEVDDNHVAFRPAPEVDAPGYADPLDV